MIVLVSLIARLLVPTTASLHQQLLRVTIFTHEFLKLAVGAHVQCYVLQLNINVVDFF